MLSYHRITALVRHPSATVSLRKHLSTATATAGGYYSIEKYDSVALITLDSKAEKVNTLSSKMMKDFESMMDTVEADDSIKAAVVSCFCVYLAK